MKVEGNHGTIGITDHAQDHLGNVVYVELPDEGAEVKQGASFGTVESVKSTSDINSPVSGKVIEVNTELTGSPGLVSVSFLPCTHSNMVDENAPLFVDNLFVLLRLCFTSFMLVLCRNYVIAMDVGFHGPLPPVLPPHRGERERDLVFGEFIHMLSMK